MNLTHQHLMNERPKENREEKGEGTIREITQRRFSGQEFLDLKTLHNE